VNAGATLNNPRLRIADLSIGDAQNLTGTPQLLADAEFLGQPMVTPSANGREAIDLLGVRVRDLSIAAGDGVRVTNVAGQAMQQSVPGVPTTGTKQDAGSATTQPAGGRRGNALGGLWGQKRTRC
jgi:hypothetical protein